MELMNAVFASPLILNDGHEIFARLEAGDDIADIAAEMNQKFGRPEWTARICQVIDNWPPLHREAAASVVRWALSKLDTEDRIQIKYRGDNEYPEVVTRIELRGHELLVEFLHPPTPARLAANGA